MGPKKPPAKKSVKPIDDENNSNNINSIDSVDININKATENTNIIRTDDITKLADQYWDVKQSNVSISYIYYYINFN